MEQNSQVQIFKNEEFGSVRCIKIDNEPWFIAKDVCDVLEIKNSRDALSRLDDDEKGVANTDTLGGMQELKTINESGLYSLILTSRKPEAKKFKKWVTNEILPSIRKHGAYMTEDTIEKALTSPDFLIQLATKLKEEQTARKLAESKLEEQKPLVDFTNTILKSKDNILVRELAKVISDEVVKIGQNRLYEKLREWGMVMKNNTEPYQRYIENGYFVLEEKSVKTPYGEKITKTTKVSPRGQVAIVEKFRKEII